MFQAGALSDDALEAVDAEVIRARKKFPSSKFLYTALCEEVGELAQAILQRKSEEEIRMEALQVACVALRIWEEGDPAYDDLTEDQSKP